MEVINEKTTQSNRIYFMSSIIAILIWSISFVATKIALTTFPPLGLGLVRFGLATLLLGSLMIFRTNKDKPTSRDSMRLIVSGLLGITIYFSLENIGVKYSTAVDAALIVASYPAITMLLEAVFFQTKYPLKSFIGVALAISGVSMIVSVSSSTEGAERVFGDILLILAGVVWAFYNFITHSVASKYSMFTITFYQITAGTIGFLPLIFLENDRWIPPTLDSLIAVIYLGALCSLLAFYLYAFGLRKISSSSAVVLMNLVPVFGVLFSFIILKESINTIQIIGGVVVIIGVVLSVGSADNLATKKSESVH